MKNSGFLMGFYFKQALIDKVKSNQPFFSKRLPIFYSNAEPTVNKVIVLDHSHCAALPLFVFGT